MAQVEERVKARSLVCWTVCGVKQTNGSNEGGVWMKEIRRWFCFNCLNSALPEQQGKLVFKKLPEDNWNSRAATVCWSQSYATQTQLAFMMYWSQMEGA